jgi:hypothetical protein
MTQYYGGPPPPPGPPAPRKNWIGSTALAVAVGGLVLCWSVVGGALLGVLAIVMGVVSRGSVAHREADNRTVATCGIALGALAVVVSLALIPAWVRLAGDVQMTSYLDCSAKATDRDGTRKCADDLQKRIDAVFRGDSSSG